MGQSLRVRWRITANGSRLPGAGREERHRDGDGRVQVGIAVIADGAGPVTLDGGQAVVEVAVPATARAVIGDPPGHPVPLEGTDRLVGVQDKPGQPLPPQRVVGGLVAAQPGAARRMAELYVDGPAA
jgi:hypothetical protein